MPDKIFQNVEIQGALKVTGTHGAHVKLPVLTTAMRDALPAVTGAAIYNSTTGRREVYNGTAWENMEDGAVVEDKIGAAAVTQAKIGADAVDGTKIEDDSIDSEHIARRSIDAEHISNDLALEIAAAWTGETEIKEVRASEKYGLANIELR